MQTPEPQQIQLSEDDTAFLDGVATTVLGSGSVAGTTAAGLTRRGFDAEKVGRLLPGYGAAVLAGNFVFKKVEPDPDAPGNYGLFIRTKRAR